MKEPTISDLSKVTQTMINDLEEWIKNVKSGKWISGETCPFNSLNGAHCEHLFDNLSYGRVCSCCPCHTYGQKETMLAFTIICDVWEAYKED